MNLLTTIYDAALEPDHWVAALDALAPTVGAQSASVMSVETVKRFDYQLSAASSRFKPEIMKVYLANYAQYEMAEFSRLAQARVGELVTAPMPDQDIEEFAKRPDVKFLRDNFGMLYRAGFRLSDDPSRVDLLAVQFHESRANITNAERQTLAPLVPHVAQALQLAKSFSVLQSRYNAALAMLDHITIGMLLVRDNGQIVLSNRAANLLLEQRDGIRRTASGCLEATDGGANSTLQGLIRDAAATATGHGESPATMLRVSRTSQTESYVIDISPMRDPDNELQSRFAGTLVSVIDPDYGVDLEASQLKSLFGLTSAEVDVADKLLSGLTSDQIADARNVSPETVKSQVKSIFRKTGTDSRAQLVRRLLNVLLPISLT